MKVEKAFYSTSDIMAVVGCSRSTAQRIKTQVHKRTLERGLMIADSKKCLISIFNEMYLGK